MATMHRLQVCLPHDLHRFLIRKAERDGVSVAEVIRRLVIHEADETPAADAAEYVLDMVGMCSGPEPLRDDVPVSECPELYLAAAVWDSRD